MTQIKTIKNGNGVQVYPQTHTKAVVDDDGYTAESRLQAMQDEINAAQLEIGAVPSDLSPTKDSTNWVTSGGIYNSILPIDEELYGKRVYNTFTEGKYINQDDGVIKSNANWAITDYIPVPSSGTITVYFMTTGVVNYAACAFYRSDMTWRSCYTTNGYTNSRTITYDYTSDNVAYIRCGLWLANIEQCQVIVDGEVVWNYSGRTGSSLVETISKLDNIDNNPTENSTNLVSSGGVFDSTKKVKFIAENTKEESINISIYTVNNYYIAWGTGKWDSSSSGSTQCIFIPVNVSRIYKLTANVSYVTRYAFLTTNTISVRTAASFASGTTQKAVDANTTAELYPPEDAKYLYLTLKIGGTNSTPQSVIELLPLKEAFDEIDEIEKGNVSPIKYDMTQTKIIDARVSSSTFGQPINATNNVWGCTQYIDLYGAKYVKYYANAVSTSNNYAGVTGTVYYNENKEPLTSGIRLISYNASQASFAWFTDIVPEGARYMRIGCAYSLNQSDEYCAYPQKISTDSIYGLQDILDDVTNKESTILNNSRYSTDGATSGTVGFLHFSDIHGDEGAAQKIRAYYDKYSSYINDMISTGDVVYYYADDGITFYTNNNLTDALLALGNHDGATSDGPNKQGSADWDAKGAQWDYETYFAPYISGWNVTQPTDAATNYLMYYYKDYTTPKVRLIVLDVMHQDAAQLQWLQDTLADAITNDYTVVVASHYVPNTYTADYIVKRADGDKTTFQSYASNSLTSIDTRFKLNTAYADAVETFITNDGKFAVWLCGHYHTDYFTYSDTHPNILFCAINQAGYRRGGSSGYRVVGDHCANMVTIHPASNLIKIHRIGITSDRFLRPINVVTYNYSSKKVISNY